MAIEIKSFGEAPDGDDVLEIRMTNRVGMSTTLISYGGTLRRLRFPDRNGNRTDCVLHYKTLEEYQKDAHYLGAIIGPMANRIANAKYSLNGKQISVEANEGKHALHSGSLGLHQKNWKVISTDETEKGVMVVVMATMIKKGEGGSPADIDFLASFVLADDNILRVTFEARPKEDAAIDMTWHPYFNLSGIFGLPINDHLFSTSASEFLAIDEEGLPTLEKLPLSDIGMIAGKDISMEKLIASEHKQLQDCGGLDHFLTDKFDDRIKASLYSEMSGIRLNLVSFSRGMQVYTANGLENKELDWPKHNSVCLEPQSPPNAINHADWPQPIVKGGEVYRWFTLYELNNSGKGI